MAEDARYAQSCHKIEVQNQLKSVTRGYWTNSVDGRLSLSMNAFSLKYKNSVYKWTIVLVMTLIEDMQYVEKARVANAITGLRVNKFSLDVY